MLAPYTELLQKSLDFRRAWRDSAAETCGSLMPLQSTDILVLGLLAQLTKPKIVLLDGAAIPEELGSPLGTAQARIETSPEAAEAGRGVNELHVLSVDRLSDWAGAARARGSDDRTPPWLEPNSFVLWYAEDLSLSAIRALDNHQVIALQALGRTVPSLWNSKLYCLVTAENKARVTRLIRRLSEVLGDPGLDPLGLYERVQRLTALDPAEVAVLREENAGLRVALTDVQDYARRLGLDEGTLARAARAPAPRLQEESSPVAAEPSDTAPLAVPSDPAILRRYLRYAHKQIAFLAGRLAGYPQTKTKDRDLLASSPFFDVGWYAENNGVAPRAAIDHFLKNGNSGRLNPSLIFDCASYLEANRDVKAQGMNPLIHYLRHGIEEGRPLAPAG